MGILNFSTVGLKGFIWMSNIMLVSAMVAIQSSLSPILFTEGQLPGDDDNQLTKSTVISFIDLSVLQSRGQISPVRDDISVDLYIIYNFVPSGT